MSKINQFPLSSVYVSISQLDTNENASISQSFTSTDSSSIVISQNKGAFPSVTIENYFDNDFLVDCKDQLLDCEFFQKSNDLYEFVQTDDLKLSAADTPLGLLRSHLTSSEFLSGLSKLTGIHSLNGDISIAGQIYSQGGYLECHDDDIQSNNSISRRIAFIIYLVDEKWNSDRQGGQLEIMKSNDKLEPTFDVINSIEPKWNRIALFPVTPASYHRVAEIISDEHLRVSLTGWFYGSCVDSYVKPPPVISSIQPSIQMNSNDKDFIGSGWINKAFVEKKNVKKMEKVFSRESCVEMNDFFTPEYLSNLYNELSKAADNAKTIGPPNSSKYQLLNITGEAMSDFIQKICSNSFASWLEKIAYFKPLQVSVSATQFKAGDYTLCHDISEKESCLELIWFISANSQFEWEGIGGDIIYMSEDEHLLSLSPRDNKFCLIYREDGVMKFIKRLSSKVPGDLFLIIAKVEIADEEEDDNLDR